MRSAAPVIAETPPSEPRLRRYSCPELVLGPGPSLSFIEKDGICCGYPQPIQVSNRMECRERNGLLLREGHGADPFSADENPRGEHRCRQQRAQPRVRKEQRADACQLGRARWQRSTPASDFFHRARAREGPATFDLEVCRAGNCTGGIVEAPRQLDGPSARPPSSAAAEPTPCPVTACATKA
jgi:hypothetical protein